MAVDQLGLGIGYGLELAWFHGIHPLGLEPVSQDPLPSIVRVRRKES